MIDRSRASQCAGKVRHRDAHCAIRALAATSRAFGDAGLQYYRCRHCGGFHIGHPPKAEQRRLRYRRILDAIDRAVASDRRPKGVR